ncbi:hypothetical protein FF38_01917 [Lucilia cuprina]|uniref:DUF243 domain-containing protein n=1 Tax=Lucilia cuprina TaxID=7375 RepID=A0A0L0CTS7_LUCCU|nr:hypothetical protein FF38_01917 [Lucilia cuprina]
MRAFIVLCLVAVACADKLGYNYKPVGHSNSGLSFNPGSVVGGGDFGSSSNVAPNYAGDFPTASHDAPAYAPQAELEKEFFTYTANDEDFHDPAASNQLANSVKQGLRVIFIKGPENKGLEDAALTLAKQAAEQKTAIYVLNKQADLGHLADKLNNVNKNSNKPEVHFVKYRTPEDAVNAQKAIQGQYDALGGRSNSHDGGVAPVLNFASKAPVPSHSAEGSAPTSSYIPPGPGASYLPASIFPADQGYTYNPELGISSKNNLEPAKETEYFLYTAPDDINDVIDSKRLANLLRPQRVIFIKNPENKIFSLTAEQLAKQQSLNIYVLQRQTDTADLQSQLQEIHERQKPRVQFIKYRTSTDIERAKQAVYNDFESIPGPSKFHQNQQTPVYEFDGRSQQFRFIQQERTTQPPILCLVALTCADKLGYNYQPVEHSDDGLSFTPGLSQDASNLLAQTLETPLQQQSLIETPAPQPAQLISEFKKEFYSYAAPEDAFDDNEAANKIAGALKKNLRVVFIKSPENKGFEEAALNLAKHAAQERTAIYVLSKQSDIGDLANKLQNLKSQSQSKPEVHFVKYRTPEDAANAQKAIQEQYNTLPGTSQTVNGGDASVLNFASRAPVSAGHIPAGPGHQYLPANPIPTADYLPPSLRRFRFRL